LTSYPSGVKLEDKPCPLGCPPDDEKILVGSDLVYKLPGEFTVVKCRTCGLMRTNPRPTLETIGHYYPSDYHPYVQTRVSPVDPPEPGWKNLVKRVVRTQLNAYAIPPIAPGRMLEIGCASGAYLNKMAQSGWEVAGIEPDQDSAARAAAMGYEVHVGNLETAPDPANHCDLIVGWMVLEHLSEPLVALRRMAGWLKPGGWLVVSVPNAASLEFRIFKKHWYALYLPIHLYHFTPRTLAKLLDAGGWKMEKVYHQRTISNLVASIGYVMHDYRVGGRVAQTLIEFPRAAWRWHRMVYPLSLVLSWFGQTGRMTVWARRV
jgi:2-polyprenyl-3-methyl-5-hydroxy-6-metoxy-1,4-benzoquinol methylase